MTEDEAKVFLQSGRAAYDVVTGWQIAHRIGGDLEWFTVTEADADVLARVQQEVTC